MKNKKLDENIRIIKSLMYEQETKEGVLSDIKNYLIDKIEGAVSDTPLEKAFDSLMDFIGPKTGEEIKKLFSLPDKKSDEMSNKEKRQYFSSVKNDDDFYAKVLWGLNLPVTTHNINFLKLWRIAEMGTETYGAGKKTAVNNPLNTTQPITYDPDQENFNSVGVKSYSRPEYGIEATIKTLKNGYYNCILDGLRNQTPYEQIADCKTGKSTKPAMDVWGTTSKHMKNVIKSFKGQVLNPKKIDLDIYDNPEYKY